MCLKSLSHMVLQRPDLFITERYLKYFITMIYDYDPTVRAAALNGVLQLFNAVHKDAAGKPREVGDENSVIKKNVEMMKPWVSKCLLRILNLVVDPLDPVGVVRDAAMILMLALLEKEGFLGINDLVTIYRESSDDDTLDLTVRILVSHWMNRLMSGQMPLASATISKALQKITTNDPGRMLDSQLKGLKKVYCDWLDKAPEQGTYSDLGSFKEATRVYVENSLSKVQELASHFSNMLMLGEHGRFLNPKIVPALKLLIIEGIRFSFSSVTMPGCKLTFLLPLSMYARSWVDENWKPDIQRCVEKFQVEMVERDDYADVRLSDLESITKFRQSMGLEPFRDNSGAPVASSVGSNVLLSEHSSSLAGLSGADK